MISVGTIGGLPPPSEALGQPQIIATTAAASPATRADIDGNLFARPPRLFVGSFRRPSTTLSAVPRARRRAPIARPGRGAAREKRRRLLRLARDGGPDRRLADRRGTPGGVLSRQPGAGSPRRAAGRISRALRHGDGGDHRLRPRRRQAGRALCHSLRITIRRDHLETLYQETGRAGRDGAPAEAIALYPERAIGELRAARFDLARVDPAAGRRAQSLSDYFRADGCRERALLAVLGEDAPPCGQCDNCRRRGTGLRRAARLARDLPREGLTLGHHGFGLRLSILSSRAGPAAEAAAEGGEPEEQLTRTPRRLTVDEDRRLRALRTERLVLARRAGIAPARLISDAALIRLPESRPSDLAELVERCGDDSEFLFRFGTALLEKVRYR